MNWEQWLKQNPDRIVSEFGPGVNASKTVKTETPTEREEQERLFAWAEEHEDEYPALRLMFAVPNGQYRQGQRMEPGLKSGVPDVLLPVPSANGDYIGLFIELKRSDRRNHPTESQNQWLSALLAQGHRCEVCYGAAEAIAVIKEYLEIHE
jgi:hypothetical protein